MSKCSEKGGEAASELADLNHHSNIGWSNVSERRRLQTSLAAKLGEHEILNEALVYLKI